MRRDSLLSTAKLIIVTLALGGVALVLLPGYWIYLATAVLITAVSLMSLGVIEGRTGMISLCQLSFAGVGAWTVGYLNVAQAPGGLPVWILIGGLASVPFGVAIGLPALRLRGINLAIVTLGFASAFDAILAATTFPGQTQFLQVPRPAVFDSDAGYFLFVLIVFALLAAGLQLIADSRLGASWLAIRHSERATAAHGVAIPSAKLSAFAISAFVAGNAGGLLAGYLGTLVADNFTMFGSLSLFAVATMTGAENAEGAVIGGLLVTLFPEILRRLSLPQDIGNVLFAVGAVQALSSGETASQALRRLLAKFRSRRARGIAPLRRENLAPRRDHGEAAALTVRALTVRYGAVVALDNVDFDVPARTVVGLIGPNGAGKSTFIDAVTGFLPRYEGGVSLSGRALEGQAAHARARLGVRRTWQTNRIAPNLTVAAYLDLAAGGLTQRQLEAALAWIGCPNPRVRVASVDAGARRLLDVAGVVAARPALVLLDEPAAGQSYDEALRLAKRIVEIPEVFGSAVLLVDHDMDLVRAACAAVTVLDFGKVIASGPTAKVLELPTVKTAYLGVVEFGGGMSALIVSNLVVNRAGLPVVRGASLSVAPASVSVLLGANGAGKTTLLEALSGVTPQAGGKIALGGEAIEALRPGARARRGLAHVEQGRTVFRTLTTDENLRAARRDANTRQAYALFPELEKRRNVRAGLLSGGEQQMLVIARALLTRPKAILIDEMSAGLAPVVVGRLMAAVRKLADGGLAVLLVEQFAALALGVGDRAYVLRRGQIVYDGACPALARAPDLLHRLYLGDHAA